MRILGKQINKHGCCIRGGVSSCHEEGSKLVNQIFDVIVVLILFIAIYFLLFSNLVLPNQQLNQAIMFLFTAVLLVFAFLIKPDLIQNVLSSEIVKFLTLQFDLSINFSQVVFVEIGTNDKGKQVCRAFCVSLKYGVDVGKEFYAFEFAEFDVSEEALDDHVSEDSLEKVAHVHLDFSAPVRSSRLHFLDFVLADPGNESDLALDELVVEDVAHDLLLHLPLAPLAENQPVSNQIFHGVYKGMIQKLDVVAFRLFFVKLFDKLCINKVKRNRARKARQSNLIFPQLSLNSVLTISIFQVIILVSSVIAKSHNAERSDIGLIQAAQYFFIVLELPIRSNDLSIHKDCSKDNDEGNHQGRG